MLNVAFETSMKSPSGKKVYILVTDSFDEPAVVQCMYQLRRAGHSVSLVGRHGHQVEARSGNLYDLDMTASRALRKAAFPDMVVIPGDIICANHLLAHPRVIELLLGTVRHGGFITAFHAAQRAFANTGLLKRLDHNHYLAQNRMRGSRFFTFLAERLQQPAGPPPPAVS